MVDSISVIGPNRAGSIATLPSGERSLLTCWEDLEALKLFWGITRAEGDLLNLSRRVRGAHDVGHTRSAIPFHQGGVRPSPLHTLSGQRPVRAGVTPA